MFLKDYTVTILRTNYTSGDNHYKKYLSVLGVPLIFCSGKGELNVLLRSLSLDDIKYGFIIVYYANSLALLQKYSDDITINNILHLTLNYSNGTIKNISVNRKRYTLEDLSLYKRGKRLKTVKESIAVGPNKTRINEILLEHDIDIRKIPKEQWKGIKSLADRIITLEDKK